MSAQQSPASMAAGNTNYSSGGGRMVLQSSSNNTGGGRVSDQMSQSLCTSLLEVSDGKGRPLPRRLLLTTTHLQIQRNVNKDAITDNDADSNRPTHGSVSDRGLSGEGSFDSFGDPPESPPPEFNKREVTLYRVDGTLGLSVRGGAEHDLPLIISRLTPGSPAVLCKQVFIGDAIIAINGVRITRLDHDEAVEYLNASGPSVTLKLKYYPTAKPFLSPTQNVLESSNLSTSHWSGGDNKACSNMTTTTSTSTGGGGEVLSDVNNEMLWETERSIPLLFGLLTRYLGGSDRLRMNAFELKDATGNASSGIIHCGDPFHLTSWMKAVADAILGLNNVQIKLWAQETQSEIYYVGWVWEGNSSADSEESSGGGGGGDESSENSLQPWLTWKPKVLAFRGPDLYYMDFPPGVGHDWDGGEVYPVITSLLRVLAAGEHLDERQHTFTLQIALENSGFPPNGARQQPISFYLNTETRAELIKVETAWTKAVTSAVKSIKKCSYSVWWAGKPCQLELDFSTASFNLYRSSSKPTKPLWTRPFSSLKGSSDDSRTRLTLKFHGDVPPETMECRDLHRVLFTIHSFLLAKVVH